MRRRALSAAAAAGLIVLSTSACATDVCPAIGWINQIIVTADSLPADAVELRLCVDGECTGDVQLPPDEPLEIATAIPEAPTEQSSGQPDLTGIAPFTVERVADDEWSFALHDMSTPESVVVQAVDAAGEPVAEATVDLDWQHEYPHGERCGGPGTAHVTVGL